MSKHQHQWSRLISVPYISLWSCPCEQRAYVHAASDDPYKPYKITTPWRSTECWTAISPSKIELGLNFCYLQFSQDDTDFTLLKTYSQLCDDFKLSLHIFLRENQFHVFWLPLEATITKEKK